MIRQLIIPSPQLIRHSITILENIELYLRKMNKGEMDSSDRKTMSYDNMRVGKTYFIRNHGETTSFLVLETQGVNDFKIKDQLSLEIYSFADLVHFGIGKDFELYEI
jgi:hypothetical protein